MPRFVYGAATAAVFCFVVCCHVVAPAFALAPLLGRPRASGVSLLSGPTPNPTSPAEQHFGLASTAPVIVLFTGENGHAEAAAAALAVERLNDDAGVPGFSAVVEHTYAQVPGLAGPMSPAAVDYLRGLPDVKFAEFDADIHVDSTAPAESSMNAAQFWNLDRADQTYLPLDSAFAYTYDGTGVEVYVVDSGTPSLHTIGVPPHTKYQRTLAVWWRWWHGVRIMQALVCRIRSSRAVRSTPRRWLGTPTTATATAHTSVVSWPAGWQALRKEPPCML